MKFVPLPFKGVGDIGLLLPPPPPPPFLTFATANSAYCLLQRGKSHRRRRLIQSSTEKRILVLGVWISVRSFNVNILNPSYREHNFAYMHLVVYPANVHASVSKYGSFQTIVLNFSLKYVTILHNGTFYFQQEFVATGLKKDDLFFGDISTLYKYQNTIVDMKIDDHSSVSTKVSIKNLMPSAKLLSASKYHMRNDYSYSQSYGNLDVQYIHPHATLHSSIGLNPTALLDLSASIGSQTVCLGGEVGFDTASSLLAKYNAGIGFNKPDFSAALMLLRGTYAHTVNPTTSVGAELIRHFSSHDNSFIIGSSYSLDPFTTVKARLSNNGKAGMVVQSEWRPKSLITLSAEYDSKAVTSSPRLGLALALKP
ncbi:unnamed protein product [Brassica rapa subsp. trilocularis]